MLSILSLKLDKKIFLLDLVDDISPDPVNLPESLRMHPDHGVEEIGGITPVVADDMGTAVE